MTLKYEISHTRNMFPTISVGKSEDSVKIDLEEFAEFVHEVRIVHRVDSHMVACGKEDERNNAFRLIGFIGALLKSIMSLTMKVA